jgi:dihydroflavonol-4-reductase
LVTAVKDVDSVFHLAGVTKAVQERTYFEVNAHGTENLVNACLEYNPGLHKFVYLSSQAAAGPSQNGCRKCEADACEPVSAYGRSKRRGEEFALACSGKLPLIILRPPAVYGPRETDLYAYFKLLSKRIQPLFAARDQHISLCYVQDVVQAILLASRREAPGGEIFFLSDGADHRADEIGVTFAKALGVTPIRVSVPKWAISGMASLSELISRFSGRPPLLNRGKVEEMVQENWTCDITKARTALRFEPRIQLEEGAKLTVDWYRKEEWL